MNNLRKLLERMQSLDLTSTPSSNDEFNRGAQYRNDYLADALAEAISADGWQKIGDEHRNGNEWLVWNGAKYSPIVVASWEGEFNGWQDDEVRTLKPQPTHAMPLPEAPQS